MLSNKYNKKELLKSPVRAWDNTSELYDEILLIPNGKKPGIDFMYITIVGIKRNQGITSTIDKYEVCGYPDSIQTFFSDYKFPKGNTFRLSKVRMDCFYPSGILRYHCTGGRFKVSESLSDMSIFYVEEK